MKLRSQLTVVAWLLWCSVILSIVLVVPNASAGPAWVLALAMLGGVRPVQRRANRFLARRAFRRLRALAAAERFTEAHELVRELRVVYARSTASLELMRFHEGSLLVLERRFGDAVRLFESIDRTRLQKNALPWLLNNLAWSLARNGQGARAVAVARESLEASATAADAAFSADDLRACQLGTLGVALVAAGEPAEALDPLEQAIARGGTVRQQVARAFYLGEALNALGRRDEARAAWHQAAEADPEDELGRRARERLDAPAPAYRS